MRIIRAHKVYNDKEFCQLLSKAGCYTMCMLPHHRFNEMKDRCQRFAQAGFLVKHKVHAGEFVTHWNATDLFYEWRDEFLDGQTNVMPHKWLKHRSNNKEIVNG